MQRLGYVPSLDGLRGVAILFVITDHFLNQPGGALGVDLFFCLSGFLITTLLLEEHAGTGRVSFVGFYQRRGRRLLPALLAFLAAFVVVEELLGHGGALLAAEGGLYTGNIAQGFFGATALGYSGIAHLWSLAEEEQFYLVWPVVLILLLRVRHPLRWLSLALAALLVYRGVLAHDGATHLRLYMGPDTHADGLVAGSLLAFFRWDGFRINRLGWLSVLFFAGFFLRNYTLAHGYTADWDVIGLPIAELGAVGLVAAAATGNGDILGSAALVWIGTISYSLYLWHGWLVTLLGQTPVALAASFAAAWLSYRFVEQPFRRRRTFRRSVAVPQAAPAD